MTGQPATWLITGSNRGIGLELARQLQARGDIVIATCRAPESADDLQDLGVRVEELDVTNHDQVHALVKRLDGAGIDVLVNNAGVGVDHTALGRIDLQRMRDFFEVNTLAPLRVASALMPNLRAGSRRLIANLTSKMGSIADNTSGGFYAYRASKAALNMVTRSLALDLAADRIICAVLHPGWVRTDMGGAHAPLAVEDSVRGLLAVIDGLTPEDSGGFFDYSGEPIPW